MLRLRPRSTSTSASTAADSSCASEYRTEYRDQSIAWPCDLWIDAAYCDPRTCAHAIIPLPRDLTNPQTRNRSNVRTRRASGYLATNGLDDQCDRGPSTWRVTGSELRPSKPYAAIKSRGMPFIRARVRSGFGRLPEQTNRLDQKEAVA